MNKNNILTSEETKQQIIGLINHSCIVPEDFIKELANMYHIETVENAYTQFDTDYKTYCDSFVE